VVKATKKINFYSRMTNSLHPSGPSDRGWFDLAEDLPQAGFIVCSPAWHDKCLLSSHLLQAAAQRPGSDYFVLVGYDMCRWHGPQLQHKQVKLFPEEYAVRIQTKLRHIFRRQLGRPKHSHITILFDSHIPRYGLHDLISHLLTLRITLIWFTDAVWSLPPHMRPNVRCLLVFPAIHVPERRQLIVDTYLQSWGSHDAVMAMLNREARDWRMCLVWDWRQPNRLLHFRLIKPSRAATCVLL